MTAVDSWQLVTRAQAGDMDAFADIYRNHQDTVYRFVRFRLGVDSDTAADLTQDTFCRALRSIGTLTWQGKDVVAWLLTIARNLTADYYKSARFRGMSNRTIDDLITDRSEPVADDDPAAEVAAAIEARTAQLLVGALLPELTEDQQRVIRLRFFDELPTPKVAEVMGKQVGAVKAAQYRACTAMRQALVGAS